MHLSYYTGCHKDDKAHRSPEIKYNYITKRNCTYVIYMYLIYKLSQPPEITVIDQPVIIPQDTVKINQPLPEITVMDQPVIIPQDTVKINQPLPEITVMDQPVIIPQDAVEIYQPLPEITVMDQPVIIPQDTVEINQPPIALLPTPPVIDVSRQQAVPRNVALPTI